MKKVLLFLMTFTLITMSAKAFNYPEDHGPVHEAGIDVSGITCSESEAIAGQGPESKVQLVNVTTPGALAALMEALASATGGPDDHPLINEWGKPANISKIKITGTLNADDLAAMNGTGWARLESVDLSEATFATGASLSDLDSDGKYFALPSSVTEITAELMSNCDNFVSACAVNGTDYVGYTNTPNMLYKANEIYGKSNMNAVTSITISGNIGVCDFARGTVADNLASYQFGEDEVSTYTPESDDYFTIPENADNKVAFEWPGNNGGPNALASLNLKNATLEEEKALREVLLWEELQECVLPDNLEEVPDRCFFQMHNLATIVIPDGVKYIGDYAFHQTPITSVKIGTGIVEIGIGAFCDCDELYDIHFEEGITSLAFDGYTFCGCDGVKQLRLPEGVTNIGRYMFDKCLSLHSVRIPSTCELIDEGAFRQCEDLKLLYIPESVQLIGPYAFDLAGIEDLYLEATTVEKLPRIYSMGESHDNKRSGASFDSKSMEANNTAPRPGNYSGKCSDNGDDGYKSITGQGDLYHELDALEMETLYRETMGSGNILCMLHYSDELKSFIDYNPWYREYPNAENEDEYLSNTYLYGDSDGNSWPTMETKLWRNWLEEPNNDPTESITRGDGTWTSDYERCLTAGDPLHAMNDNDPWIGTNGSLLNIAYNPETGGEPSRVGWRQFVIKMGTHADPKKTITKEYSDVWYTFCFPYDLTNEQLNTAFNAYFNIVEFNAAEIVENGVDALGNTKYNLIFHFEQPHQASYTYTDPTTGTVYHYQRNVDENNNVTFTPIDGGPNDVTRDDLESYLAEAFHAYMIHPNLGIATGDKKKRCAFINLIDKENEERTCENCATEITTNKVSTTTYGDVEGTYTFIGNVDYLTEEGKAWANEHQQPTFNVPMPVMEVKGDEPIWDDDAEKADLGLTGLVEMTEAPEVVPNPAADTETYPENFQTFYNSVIKINGQNYLMGEYIADNGITYFANGNHQDYIPGYQLKDWNEYKAYADIFKAFTGRNDYLITDDDVTYLISKSIAFKEALDTYNNGYASEYALWLKWEQYRANYQAYLRAHDRWENYSEEAAQEEYDALMDLYNAAYSEYEQALKDWNDAVAQYRPLIPFNSYFLATPKDATYPKYYREASKDMNRKSGFWTQYSCVIKSDGEVESKLFGIDLDEDSSINGFNFVIGEYTPTTDDIKNVLEDAKKNNLPVQYIDIIYDINGQMISPKADNDLRNLPKGIYIVNGKKYLVK